MKAKIVAFLKKALSTITSLAITVLILAAVVMVIRETPARTVLADFISPKPEVIEVPREPEKVYLGSEVNTVLVSESEKSVIRRIKKDGGDFITETGTQDLMDLVEFRPAGSQGFLFPVRKNNPARLELGVIYGKAEIHYPPAVNPPEGYDWVKVDDPMKAGTHRSAVLDTGMVWAVEKIQPPILELEKVEKEEVSNTKG